MLNHIVIMGRMVRDPELRRTGSGIAVASFTVAVDRDYSSKDGGEKEVDFIDCNAWRNTGEFVSKHFTRGRMAIVSGRLQIRNWTDKDGNKRKAWEVVTTSVELLSSKKDSHGNNNPQQNQNGYNGPQQGYNPNSYERQVNAPQYNQQGFGGYAPIEGADAQLPF